MSKIHSASTVALSTSHCPSTRARQTHSCTLRRLSTPSLACGSLASNVTGVSEGLPLWLPPPLSNTRHSQFSTSGVHTLARFTPVALRVGGAAEVWFHIMAGRESATPPPGKFTPTPASLPVFVSGTSGACPAACAICLRSYSALASGVSLYLQ